MLLKTSANKGFHLCCRKPNDWSPAGPQVQDVALHATAPTNLVSETTSGPKDHERAGPKDCTHLQDATLAERFRG